MPFPSGGTDIQTFLSPWREDIPRRVFPLGGEANAWTFTPWVGSENTYFPRGRRAEKPLHSGRKGKKNHDRSLRSLTLLQGDCRGKEILQSLSWRQV